jgi:chaperone BCS1
MKKKDNLSSLQSNKINKLGLLLYGIHGGGKTSIIKSIANYTKRHVISIKLSQIKSDNDLMKIFFHQCFSLNLINSSATY